MSLPSEDSEFRPLFDPGLHMISLNDLRRICVNDFPLSTTRHVIMDGFLKLLNRIKSIGIEGELWIDGSFLTDKIDPRDLDFVLSVSAEHYDNSSEEMRSILDEITKDDLKPNYACDCYLKTEWPKGHPLYGEGQRLRRYWINLFGHARGGDEKGIAVIRLQDVSI